MADGAKCRNCGTPLELRYCASCGQDRQEPPAGLPALVRLIGTHLTGLEGVAVKTLRVLLLSPGRLTRAYVEGRRVRYASPVRLYLWCTAGFFLWHAYSPFVRLDPETGAVRSTLSALSVETELSGATMARISAQGMSLGSVASALGIVVALGYLALAMRIAYRRSWAGSVARAVVCLVLFGVLLAVWLWSTTRVAAGLASWGAFQERAHGMPRDLAAAVESESVFGW